MGLWHDAAVYFGFADETAEARDARQTALLRTSPTRMVLSAILAALVTGALIGVIRCLLEGEAVTLARILEKGWLLAVVVTGIGTARALWERRQLRAESGPRPGSPAA